MENLGAEQREGANRDGEEEGDLDRSWGMAPPYGAYRGRYGDYQLAQTGSMGSGQLGGWSGVGLGGFFGDGAAALPAAPHPPEHEPEAFPED